MPLSLAARVTLQQLVVLDAAHLENVAVAVDASAATRAYVRWQGGAGFGDFLTSVAGR